MNQLYQVIGWEENFEGAKSKTYQNKTSCQMPTKHGLGYKRLVRSEHGAALFGAWCAMIQLLSRQPKPRSGFLTDNGKPDGRIYTAEDLETLTDIPEKVFEELLQKCISQEVGWLVVATPRIPQGYHADTTGDQRDTMVPLDLDSDSDSDLDSDSDSKAETCFENHPRMQTLRNGNPVFRAVSLEQWLLILQKRSKHMDWTKAIEFVLDKAVLQPNIEKPAVFVDSYLGFYEKDHRDEIDRNTRLAVSRQTAITELADFIREGGMGPESVKRQKDRMRERYGDEFINQAELEAAKTKGRTA